MADAAAPDIWPSATQRSQLQRHLADLATGVAGIRVAVVASVDGFALASAGDHAQGGDRLAAMTSSMLGLAAAVGRELALGTLETLLLDASHGKVLMRAIACARQPVLLMAACAPDAVTGTVLWSTKDCGRKILADLGGP